MPKVGKKGSIGRELASARRSLRALEQSLARLAAQVRDISRSNSAKPAGKPRRMLKLMPARGRGPALRAKKGVKVAIKRARKLAAAKSARR